MAGCRNQKEGKKGIKDVLGNKTVKAFFVARALERLQFDGKNYRCGGVFCAPDALSPDDYYEMGNSSVKKTAPKSLYVHR